VFEGHGALDQALPELAFDAGRLPPGRPDRGPWLTILQAPQIEGQQGDSDPLESGRRERSGGRASRFPEVEQVRARGQGLGQWLGVSRGYARRLEDQGHKDRVDPVPAQEVVGDAVGNPERAGEEGSFALFDRQQGAAERLHRHGYNLISILRLKTLLNYYHEIELIESDWFDRSLSYLENARPAGEDLPTDPADLPLN
jgi:hypothetical protein